MAVTSTFSSNSLQVFFLIDVNIKPHSGCDVLILKLLCGSPACGCSFSPSVQMWGSILYQKRTQHLGSENSYYTCNPIWKLRHLNSVSENKRINGQMQSYHGPRLNNNAEGNNFIDYDSIERNFIDQISRLAKINNNALAQRAPMGKRRRCTQYTHCRRVLQNYFFIIFFEEFPNIHVSMFLCCR